MTIRANEMKHPDVYEEKEIRGVKFVVRVNEKNSPKIGKKKKRVIGVWAPGSSLSIASEAVYSKKDGLLTSKKALPPLEDQIADLVNEAVSQYFDEQEKLEEMKKKTGSVLDVVKETWEDPA